MKVSYNWLKNYLDFNYSPQELSEILTQTGLEVEGIEPILEIQGGLTGVVIGEVLSCEQHPDANKLKITKVSIGADSPLQIVCGAPNVAVGQKVVVATVGAKLYPQVDQVFEIKKAKIRGVASEGMLCAEDELGLGESHDGIIVLEPSSPVGKPASDFFKLENDFQLEIGLTPNRSDALGHIGVARDIKAVYNLKATQKLTLQLPDFPNLDNSNLPQLDIQIQDLDGCKRYFAIGINDIKVCPSPKWLQNRLKAVGLKPINNIVDISNFVQRELGTPLHIFDRNQCGNKINVRCAKPNETFTGLDNTNYKLAGHELVIANGEHILCLAGILGGAKSGVTEKTTNILIESALFDPVRIRKGARQHGLNTDASFRFERGVDPELTLSALQRCVSLILDSVGGNLGSSTFKFNGEVPKAIELSLKKSEITKLIGNEIATHIIQQILDDLDFQTLAFEKDIWKLKVPTYRVDVTRAVDVIEEIARIYGLNNIQIPEKWNFSIGLKNEAATEIQKSSLAEFLVGRGYYEAWNNSLTKKQYTKYFDQSPMLPVSIINPLSQDLEHLRQSLLFGLLENLQYNQNRQLSNIQLFEFGQVHHQIDSKRNEHEKYALILMGKQQTDNWNLKENSHNFFSLKKEVYAILERLGLNKLAVETTLENDIFEYGREINANGHALVQYGEVKLDIQQDFDIKSKVFYAEFNWKALCDEMQNQTINYVEVAKTFAVRRDLSLLIDQHIEYSDLIQSALNAERKLLTNIELFDVYEGKNLPSAKKSYALAFYLQDKTQTLSESQIEKAMQRILGALQKDCSVSLRQ